MERISIAILLIVACLAVHSVPATGDVTLVRDGRTDYVIVMADQPAEPDEIAAWELQKYVQQVTGATLPIRREPEVAADVPRVLVGQSATAKSLMPGLDWSSLGSDGIVMKIVGRDLFLAGGRPRGTLYSVYTFLEDVVGCRWWTSTESYIPKKKNLVLSSLDVTYVPPLRYREAYYRDTLTGSLFAVQMKLNGENQTLQERYGGNLKMLGWVHTFYKLLPPETYFKDHPEWYSEINGKRTTNNAQLCLTNEVMRKELTKVALDWIKADPTAGIISISQNDWGGRCECEKCKALEEKEGSPSGSMIHFVNAVAEDIEKQYPNMLVETLAYQYTKNVPLHVKPRDNVLIRLCTDGCEIAQPFRPIKDSFRKADRDFQETILAWSDISKNLFIWDYVANYGDYLLIHPNTLVLGPNLRFFTENHAVGVFEEGGYMATAGNFVQMHAWMISHLLWEPSRDDRKLMQEFLDGYYGAAAPHLSAYIDLVSDAMTRPGTIFRQSNHELISLTLSDMNEATRLFTKAEKAVAGNPMLLKRVRRERICVDYMWLKDYRVLRDEAVLKNAPFLGPKDPAVALKDFEAAACEFDVRYRDDSMTKKFSALCVRLENQIRDIPSVSAK